MSKGKYTWSDNQTDEIWYGERFDTIEECIADARGTGKEIGSKIAIGICEDYIPHVDCDTLLDRLNEDAYEVCGEVAENFPYFERGKGYKDIELLQEKIDKALNEWLEETNQTPTFYHIIPLKDMYEVK